MNPKAAVIQLVSGACVQDNLEAAARQIAAAAAAGASLVLLPENFAVLDAGPLPEFAEEKGRTDSLLQGFLSAQAARHGITLIGGTIPLITRPRHEEEEPERLGDGRVRPACLVYGPQGALLARYDKIHLFDVEVEDKQSRYSESLRFEPGDEIVCVDTPAGRVGLSICYDLRFAELYQSLREQGAQLLTVPSAFTQVTGAAHWEVLLRARAIENQCYVLAANQGGVHNDKRETYGHSMIVDPWGTVLAKHEKGEGFALAQIDLSHLERVRSRMPVHSHRRLF